jgi:hypothetical protein
MENWGLTACVWRIGRGMENWGRGMENWGRGMENWGRGMENWRIRRP